jgi:hypothetical protein
VVAAGLEVDVQGGLAGVITGILQGHGLGVRFSRTPVKSGADDTALLHHDGSDERIGRDERPAETRQRQGQLHIFSIRVTEHGAAIIARIPEQVKRSRIRNLLREKPFLFHSKNWAMNSALRLDFGRTAF